MQEGLLRDIEVLRLLGSTAREMREGFDPERNRGEPTPWHGDSVRYSLKHTPVDEFYQAFIRCQARWIKAGFIKRRGTYILDAKKTEVDSDYAGAGRMTVTEERMDAQGKRQRDKVVKKGFNLVTLSSLLPTRKLLVVRASRGLPLQQPEITVSDALIDEVWTAMGNGAIRLRLLDRGWLDGERLGRWYSRQMDVLVPVKHNMSAKTTEAMGLDSQLVAAMSRSQGSPFFYNQLVRLDYDLKPQPELAKGWETPHPTTWIFHLREGVTFHDGQEFTSADVKFIFDRLFDKSPGKSDFIAVDQVTRMASTRSRSPPMPPSEHSLQPLKDSGVHRERSGR